MIGAKANAAKVIQTMLCRLSFCNSARNALKKLVMDGWLDGADKEGLKAFNVLKHLSRSKTSIHQECRHTFRVFKGRAILDVDVPVFVNAGDDVLRLQKFEGLFVVPSIHYELIDESFLKLN